ncbi:MAG TPA: helix-turn-helix transcriptional regulator [Ramlibacter sp.]|jgi:DNA-binding transcriptional regulator YiaG|nr:helix-turn-helix transcriptional regulator [Ramlibacter sp.]
MPDIATALKAEISRLARKELRVETDALKKAVSHYRSEIAALKRRMQQLERQQARGARAKRAAASQEGDDAADAKHRFSAKGLFSCRKRLGLSAADFGRLVGVSQLSIYKWESGQQRPRQRYLPAIAAVRKMGKREALARLEQLA